MPTNLRPEQRARFRIPARSGRPPGPVVRSCHGGTTVSLLEWTCGGHPSAHQREEWAERHEVIVPRQGAFECEIAGTRGLADPNSATLLNPAEPYRVRHPVGGDAGTLFVLPAPGVRALLARHDPDVAEGETVRFPTARVPLDGRTYLLHRLALRAASDPHASALEVEERSAAFLREVVAQAYGIVGRDRAGGSGRPDRAAEYAARVTEVVAARYREPVTLEEVARAVGASPYHLSRMVTRATGVPIYRMVLRRRLRDALELLLATRETIARIAVTVGFASHSHLTEAFRREFGVLPHAVRRGGAGAVRAQRR